MDVPGVWRCLFSAHPNWPATIRPPFLCCKTWCESSKPAEHYDAILTLQPTTPLRRPEDIDGAITLLEQTGADAVISFVEVGENIRHG